MIKVTTDPARQLIIAHMSGFLSTEEVDQYARDKDAAVAAMGWRSGEYLLLIDTAKDVIQPQEIVAAFQHLAINTRYKPRRIAVTRTGSLTRMQTNRILSVRDNTAVFDTVEAAEAWLFADDESGG